MDIQKTMNKSNYTALINGAKDIEKNTGGFVVLSREKNNKYYGRWMLFIDGQYCYSMRASHAMAFVDGWKVAEVASDAKNKAVLLRVECTKPL
jgi:hypothetical protein